MSQFGMKPYFEWVLLANRYNKAVDFGSPISSWTPEMLKQDREKRNSEAVMTKKVFCESCRHYGYNGLGGYCRSVANMDSNYYSENYSYGTPDIINQDNNCPNWERKRTFIEWFNDLIT
jgi:hypothetical protein